MLRSVVTMVVVSLFTVPVYASEDCSKMGGTCRTACGANEIAEAGAFEDCAEKDECCVPRSSGGDTVRCCVRSFDAASFGRENCEAPRNSVCARGSASPAPCEKLPMCRN